MNKDKKPHSKKKWIIIIIVLALVIALVVGIVVKKKQASVATQTQTFTRTVTLSYGSLDDTVVEDGTLSSQNTSSITSTVSNAQVKQINVSVGDYVEEGDVIIVLDSESIEEQIDKQQKLVDEQEEKLKDDLDDAEDAYDDAYDAYHDDYTDRKNIINAYKAVLPYQEAVDTATNNVNTAAANYINSGYLIDENNNIYKLEADGITKTIDVTKTSEYASFLTAQSNANAKLKEVEDSYDDFASLEKNYQTASSTEKSLKNALENAENALDKAQDAYDEGVDTDTLDDLKEQLSDCNLKAKSSGQITAINATVGQIASGTLATIQDTDKLTVTISVDEYDISSIEVGQRAKITTDAVDGEFEGEVVSISPVSSGATGGGMMLASTSSSFDVEIDITSDTDGLLIGMSCEVTIYLSSIDNVFTVPVSAIETVGDKSYIYVQNSEGEFVQTEVTTGETSGYYTEVSGDNIKEGDVVRFSYNEDEAEVDVDASDMAGMNFGGDMPTGGGNMPTGGGNMPNGGGAPAGGFGG